jgi:hypothetical protein
MQLTAVAESILYEVGIVLRPVVHWTKYLTSRRRHPVLSREFGSWFVTTFIDRKPPIHSGTPWLNFSTINWLDRFRDDRRPARVFEFGSGGSTMFDAAEWDISTHYGSAPRTPRNPFQQATILRRVA